MCLPASARPPIPFPTLLPNPSTPRALPPFAGAPHVVDEAAAIFFGTTCFAGSLADVANKRAATFGTLKLASDGTTCTA